MLSPSCLCFLPDHNNFIWLNASRQDLGFGLCSRCKQKLEGKKYQVRKLAKKTLWALDADFEVELVAHYINSEVL